MLSIMLLTLLVQAARTPEAPPKMKTYQMVLLREGNNPATGPEAEKAQNEHLAYLIKLNRERVNLLFGPFVDNEPLRGIAVLDVPDAETARKLFADDPHVKAGNLQVDVKPWLGPVDRFQPPAETDVTKPGALEQLVSAC